MTRAVASAPSAWFTDPEFLARERAAVFAPHWHYVGSAEDVAEPGSFMAADLGGLPIVVTRDTDGRLRALANVCRHRGHLVAEGCGKRKTLQCRYHGWTYLLDGSLHRAPGAEVDPAERPAAGARRAATVGPLLFACVDRDVAPLDGSSPRSSRSSRDVSHVDARAARPPPQRAPRDRRELEGRRRELHGVLPLPARARRHAARLRRRRRTSSRRTTRSSRTVSIATGSRGRTCSRTPRSRSSATTGRSLARQIVPDGVGRTRATIDYWFDRDVTGDGTTTFIDWFEAIIAEDVPLCTNVQIGNESGLLDTDSCTRRRSRGRSGSSA